MLDKYENITMILPNFYKSDQAVKALLVKNFSDVRASFLLGIYLRGERGSRQLKKTASREVLFGTNAADW
ncbi:MAG: hypothetical protein JRJ66_04270 [Deltaproteobacteria bacterium]|nr:hypothetical protein [Deltaproteobacteria bacterium]MBW2043932.1 hypothetical protein [Deltaproteobacteria bacterium]